MGYDYAFRVQCFLGFGVEGFGSSLRVLGLWRVYMEGIYGIKDYIGICRGIQSYMVVSQNRGTQYRP